MVLPLSPSGSAPGTKQILQLELWSENMLGDEFIGAVEINLQKVYTKQLQTGVACRKQLCLQVDTGGTITCSLTFGDTIAHFRDEAEKSTRGGSCTDRHVCRVSAAPKQQQIAAISSSA